VNRRQLLLRLLFKAAWVRKDRALTALVSVAVVATIATAALTIYSDLEGKLGREFRGFGANVIVTRPSGTLSADELAKTKLLAGGKGKVVPVAYAIASGPYNTKVVIAGADLKSLWELNSFWEFHPGDRSTGGTAWLGSRAATLFAPQGRDFYIAYADKKLTVRSELIFHSGSDDDSRVYLELAYRHPAQHGLGPRGRPPQRNSGCDRRAQRFPSRTGGQTCPPDHSGTDGRRQQNALRRFGVVRGGRGVDHALHGGHVHQLRS
jgi:hypothetical protein